MDDLQQYLLEEHRKGTINRGELLRWAAVLGVALPLLDAQRALAGPARHNRVAAPVRGGTLRLVTTSPTSIEPPQLNDVAGPAVVQPVCDYLIKLDTHGNLVPDLALTWKTSDGGKTWVVTLRPNVKFNNGQPFTAKDVAATFDRLVDPKRASTAKSALPFLSKGNTEARDDLTVVFHLARAVVDFPYYISIATYQAAILPANWPGNFARNPIGTGPFKLVEYQSQQRARYQRNPSYWQAGLPYLDSVEVLLGLDAQSQVTALLGGSADAQVGTESASLPVLRASSGIKILNANTSGYDEVAMRVDQKPFIDKRVRQALAFCLDRPSIVKAVLNGAGQVANDNVVFSVFPLWTHNGQRKQDYARAKALLASAGHPHGFGITLVTTKDALNLVPLATVLQQQLQPVGIQVTISLQPGSTYYNTPGPWTESTFDIVDWAARPTPSQTLSIGYRSGAAYNSSHFANKSFDSLLDLLDSTLDFARRKAIVLQLENIMTDQTPALIPYSLGAPRAMRKNVQGLVADPSNFVDLSQTYLGSS
ncbi:MAG TPA: ABC transporter substrate-binding protein [Chloroflexota bacterium]|nr:ABC transporter substrate-binding protein [Chloroflexota bacterium]